MASPKNWKKKKTSSKGIMVWQHTSSPWYVAVKEYSSGPGGRNTQGKTGRYMSIARNPQTREQVQIVNPNSRTVNTENKKRVRKETVRWMRNHPNP